MVDFSLIDLQPEECRTLVDVGANEGQFLTAALGYYRPERVLAIEMLDDYAAKLRRMPGVTVVQCAVGAEHGCAMVKRSVYSQASSLLEMDPRASEWYGWDLHQYNYGSVEVRTLDAICAEHGIDSIDLLKIDVQGYEDAVLRGAARMLQQTRRLMIEVEFRAVYAGQALAEEIRSMVEAAGFTYVCNLTEYPGPNDTLLHADALFRR